MSDKKDETPENPAPKIPDTLPADVKARYISNAQHTKQQNWTEFLEGNGDITEYNNGKKTDYPSR